MDEIKAVETIEGKSKDLTVKWKGEEYAISVYSMSGSQFTKLVSDIDKDNLESSLGFLDSSTDKALKTLAQCVSIEPPIGNRSHIEGWLESLPPAVRESIWMALLECTDFEAIRENFTRAAEVLQAKINKNNL